jgi:hypothetical protein
LVGKLLEIEEPISDREFWHISLADGDGRRCLPLPVIPASHDIVGVGSISLKPNISLRAALPNQTVLISAKKRIIMFKKN